LYHFGGMYRDLDFLFAKNPNTESDALYAIWNNYSDDAKVANALAQNTNTPYGVIDEMLSDGYFDSNKNILSSVINHQPLDNSLFTNLLRTIQSSTSADIQALLSSLLSRYPLTKKDMLAFIDSVSNPLQYSRYITQTSNSLTIFDLFSMFKEKPEFDAEVAASFYYKFSSAIVWQDLYFIFDYEMPARILVPVYDKLKAASGVANNLRVSILSTIFKNPGCPKYLKSVIATLYPEIAGQ
jgi:hypothetical protein